MKRREFISLIGSASVAWPLAARAQQEGKLPPSGPGRGRFAVECMDSCFRAATARTRLDRGRTMAIEYRWAEGRSDRSPKSRPSSSASRSTSSSSRGVAALKQAKRSSLSSLPLRATQFAAAWSQAWRGRAAMSLDFRSRRPILPASGSSCCVRLSPAPAIGNHG